MDSTNENTKEQPTSQTKTKIFVLTPDKIKQLGISNLLKQFQVPNKSSNLQGKEIQSTSKNPVPNNEERITEPIQEPAQELKQTQTPNSPKQNISNPLDNPPISPILGLSMKDKLTSILLKEDVKPRIGLLDAKVLQKNVPSQNIGTDHLQKDQINIQEVVRPSTSNLKQIKAAISQKNMETQERHFKIEIHEEPLPSLETSEQTCGDSNIQEVPREHLGSCSDQTEKVLQNLSTVEEIIKTNVSAEPQNSKQVTPKSLSSSQNPDLIIPDSYIEPQTTISKMGETSTTEKSSPIKVIQNIRLGGFKSPLKPSEDSGGSQILGLPISDGLRIENIRLGGFKKNLTSKTGSSSKVTVKTINTEAFRPRTPPLLSSFKETLSEKFKKNEEPQIPESKQISNLKKIVSNKIKHSQDLKKGKVTKTNVILPQKQKNPKEKIPRFKNILSQKMKENDLNQSKIILESATRKSSRKRKSTFSNNKDYIWGSKTQTSDSESENDELLYESENETSLLDESITESEIVVPEKKIVGRSRKTKQEIKKEYLTEEEDEEDQGEEKAEGEVRNQARQDQSLSEAINPLLVIGKGEHYDEPQSSLPQELLVKRRRGRPRIIKVYSINEQNLEADSSTPKVKKRVGRPRKYPLLEESQSEDTAQRQRESDSEAECQRKKFCRKINESQNESDFSGSDDSVSPNKSKKISGYVPVEVDRRKFKKDYPPVSYEDLQKALEIVNTIHHGKKSLVKQKEEDDAKKAITRYFKTQGTVTCGKCNIEMEPNMFHLHNYRYHYNLGWRVGEPEVNLDDEKKVISLLLTYLKNSKTKAIKCEKCGDFKKSAAGYLSHINVCQKTAEELLAQRVTCQLCKRSYSRSSIKTHLATSHLKVEEEISKDKGVDTPENSLGNNGEEKTEESGRRRRKAAEKATNLIQEVIKIEPDVTDVPELTKSFRLSLYTPEDLIAKKKVVSSVLQWSYIKELSRFKETKCKFRDCVFSGTTITELREHSEECKGRFKDHYICRYCLYVTKTRQQFNQHYKKVHEGPAVKGDLVDFIEEEIPPEDIEENKHFFKQIHEEQDEKPRTHKIKSKVLFLTINRSGPATQHIIYSAAYKWTLQLYENNFSKFLYPKAFREKCNYNLIINDEEKPKYMPVNTVSMDVETVKLNKSCKDNQGTERNWKKFNLFESETQDDTITIYCGGPIWSVAWAPTPYKLLSDQILAVSCLRQHNRNFPVNECSASSEMIQFWNFGPLKNRKKTSNLKPKLEFCLAHDHGNVWCIEWCPSGCYNEYLEDLDQQDQNNKLARIGLLALACSDGSLPIYTISREYLLKPKCMNSNINVENLQRNDENTETIANPETEHAEISTEENEETTVPILENVETAESDSNFTESNEEEVKIYKTKPTFNLILSDNIDQNLGVWPYQCIKISWSKYQNHNIIAAGYSNGIVSLWDLTTESPLLRSEKDGVIILRPYHLFKAHEGPVTALCLSPLENGKKWLFTGSHDRTAKFWNLDNTTHPNTVFNKNLSVYDGAWLSHWMVTFCCYDDSTFLLNTNLTIQAIRNFMCDQCTSFPTNSPQMSVSTNDWGNQLAVSNFAGELGVMFPHQLLTNNESKKADRGKRQLVTFSELIDKKLSPAERLKKCNDKVAKNIKTEGKSSDDIDDKKILKQIIEKNKDSSIDLEELTYEEAKNRYGLIFNDPNMNTKDVIPEISKKLRRPVLMNEAPSMMYPLMSINRVAWNPNKQAYLYIASGYNAGFLRIHCIRHMNNVHIERTYNKQTDK